MRTFEISLGNGITEVVDLGDEHPLIPTMDRIFKGQEHLRSQIAFLTKSAEAARTIPEAIKTLTKALRDDPGYRIGWQANIAMAFQDEYNRVKDEMPKVSIHAISNAAAQNFIELLCMDSVKSNEGKSNG